MIFVNFSEIRIKDADWNVGGLVQNEPSDSIAEVFDSTDRAIFVET